MAFEKLDIIIPQYNETEDEVRPLLSSIANQVGVSKDLIKVTIVNDHSQWKFSDSFLSSFGLDITYLETPENGGAGMARQWGVDHTSNPLIMFCDADDRLFDCTALLNLYNAMRLNNAKNNKWTLLTSSFYEEQIIGERGYNLVEHDKPTMIWMHGKVFRRDFIEKNNIRFLPGLRTFEDTFFGKLYTILCPQMEQIHCNYYTYFWKRNPKSITSNWNHDGKDYLFWNNNDYIMCNRNLIAQLVEKDPKNSKTIELIWVNLFFIFFMLQFKEFNDENEDTIAKRDALIKFFLEIVSNYSEYIIKTPMGKRAGIYHSVYCDMPRYRFYVERITWHGFIKILGDIIGDQIDLSCLLIQD